MTTSTLTVTEFVEARLGEDEARAHQWPDEDKPPPEGYPYWVDSMGHPIWAPRTRVLAQCAAMRKIVEDCQHLATTERRGLHSHAVWIVRQLASIWSDHPAWREEWR